MFVMCFCPQQETNSTNSSMERETGQAQQKPDTHKHIHLCGCLSPTHQEKAAITGPVKALTVVPRSFGALITSLSNQLIPFCCFFVIIVLCYIKLGAIFLFYKAVVDFYTTFLAVFK